VEALARKSPAELTALVEQIAGSAGLADDYRQRHADKEQAQQNTVFLLQQQKTLRAERKLLKEQKTEADRFHQLLTEKADVETELYLWILYHLDRDRHERDAVLGELRDERDAHRATEQTHAETLQQAKKQASAARRETGQRQQRRVELAALADRLEPAVIQTTEEIKSLANKLAQDEKQVAKKQTEADTHRERIDAIAKEIADYRTQLTALERDYDEIKANAAPVQLTPEQETRYEALRYQAAAASAAPRHALHAAQRRLEQARAHVATLQHTLQEAQAAQAETARDVQALDTRREKLTKVRWTSGWVVWHVGLDRNGGACRCPCCVLTLACFVFCFLALPPRVSQILLRICRQRNMNWCKSKDRRSGSKFVARNWMLT
jgi:structural maintenance of chromosome 1